MENMGNAFVEVLEEASKKAKREQETYIGEDGLKYCSNCHSKTQTKVNFLGKERVVNCLCKCQQAKRDKEETEYKKMLLDNEIKTLRSEAFQDSDMKDWTFKNDDKENVKLTQAMKKYVENFDKFLREGKGLLLWGEVGTGKTYMAACIVNALIDQCIPCLVTNFSRLVNTLQGMYDGKQDYIDSLNKYQLIVIDDLGIERNSEYVMEQVYNIIDGRYRAKLPMILTTNLTIDEIKHPQNIQCERIYDRILERCHPIKVEGNSRRREHIKKSYNETKNILGM